MFKEDLNKDQTASILSAVAQLQEQADVSLAKNDLLDMYTSSLTDDDANATPMQRLGKFHSFKHLYNFLLRVQMQYEPQDTGVNLLDS